MLYRVRQFVRASLVPVRTAERALAARHLSDAEVALFERMGRADQRHGLDVFYALRDAGHTEPALLRAALLHDVGKETARFRVWHRVAVVLLNRFAPSLLARLAADGRGWKAPFAVHLLHPALGADQARSAGSSPETVALIRRHHEPASEDERLAALQRADSDN